MKCFLILFSLMTVACTELAGIVTECKGKVLESRVVRTGFYTPQYVYDLYSSEGVLLAQAVSRICSWGLFYTRFMEFDVYDEIGGCVGSIRGESCTDELAKFVFMNADAIEVGSALLRLDSEKVTFLILSPENAIVALFNGMLSENFSGWEFHIKQPVGIDARMLKIFGAFISDFHNTFTQMLTNHGCDNGEVSALNIPTSLQSIIYEFSELELELEFGLIWFLIRQGQN